MLVYSLVVITLTIFYGALMLWYWYGWIMTKQQTSIAEIFTTTVTVVIPARNEEENIAQCLTAIFNQRFPGHLLEVIVVDDNSTDNTPEIVKRFNNKNLKLISLHEKEDGVFTAYKKRAVETAINNASGKLIVTTDADCTMEPLWLASVISYYESNSYKMIAAPVLFKEDKNMFEEFQSLDFLGLMGITCSSIFHQFPVMCNGANLAYEKQAFYDVNGFEGIDYIASGDDMLLMLKLVKKYPHSLGFLKSNDAAVFTYPQHSVSEFFMQRSRWASKSAHYSDKRITAILVAAYLFNLLLVINIVGALFSGLILKLLFAQVIIKLVTEFLLLGSVASFFKRKDLLSVFLPAQFMHIIYVLIVGITGTFAKQKWKGRVIR
jgi:cellulose synthase/poly-beta-1,6-N-acetylglucosamine synthase-like glycosyltransferase